MKFARSNKFFNINHLASKSTSKNKHKTTPLKEKMRIKFNNNNHHHHDDNHSTIYKVKKT